MADFVRVHLADDTVVLVQTSESDLVRAHSAGPVVEEMDAAAQQLESFAAAAHEVSKSLRDRMSPDELKLEIGVGLSGEVGWFFAKSALDASLKVTLTWKGAPGGSEDVSG